MKSLFVSRLAYETALARADAEHENAMILRAEIADLHRAGQAMHALVESMTVSHRHEIARLSDDVAFARNSAKDLLDRYHALREKGYGHIEAVPIAAAPDVFGPRTRAALDLMSKGLPRDSRVAMEAKARDMVEAKMDDGHIADAVRRGEPLRIAQ